MPCRGAATHSNTRAGIAERDVSQALEPDSPVGASGDEAVAAHIHLGRKQDFFVHRGRSATQTAAAEAEQAFEPKVQG